MSSDLQGSVQSFTEIEDTLAFPFLNTSFADGNIVVAYPLNYLHGGYIKAFFAIAGAPVTTGSKLTNVTMKINSAAVAGGILALTSANLTPLGAKVVASPTSGNVQFNNGDTLTLICDTTTAFIEGSATLYVVIGQPKQNRA